MATTYIVNRYTGLPDATGTGGGGGAVDDVSNVDGTLTISPTTGSVVASLNLNNANSWVGKQTFTTTAPRFSTLTTNGGIFYGNASGDLQQTGAGTSTQVLHGGTSPTYGAVVLTTDVSGILPVANGGSGTSTTFTTGSVIFAGASGVYSQDNSNFYWDNTNKWQGIGAAPSTQFHVNRTALNQYANPVYTGQPQAKQAWFIDNRDDGLIAGLEVRNTNTSGLAFAGFGLSLGTGTEGGSVYASRAAIASYAIVDGLNFTPNSVTQDIGFRVGAAALGGTANGPQLYLQGSTEFVGIGTTSLLGQLHVQAKNATTIGQVVQAAATPTANWTSYLNSAGTTLLGISPGLLDPFGNTRDIAISFGSNVGLIYTTSDTIDFRINGGVAARGLRVVSASVVGTNDTFFQAACTASGYGCFEGYSGAGTAILSYPDTPILFCPNRTEKMRLTSTTLTLADAINIAVNTTTGTKIGTATTQKLAFFNSTPIVQPANTVSLETVLSNLGLRASGTTAPLSIGNLTIADGSNVILDTTTGTKFGTATTQKIGFLNATPIVQQANSVSLEAVLSNFGFRASGTAAPISVGVMTATTSANVIAGTSTRAAKIGGAVIDYYTDAANSGTTETDLYTTTLEANILGANGDKLVVRYGISLPTGSGATRNIKMYFGGSAIFGTGPLTYTSSGWMDVHVEIIRVSSTVIRYTAFFQNTGYGSVPLVGGAELTGLTLSSTNVIKITGQAGAGGASNDIVAKCGSIKWYPAA